MPAGIRCIPLRHNLDDTASRLATNCWCIHPSQNQPVGHPTINHRNGRQRRADEPVPGLLIRHILSDRADPPDATNGHDELVHLRRPNPASSCTRAHPSVRRCRCRVVPRDNGKSHIVSPIDVNAGNDLRLLGRYR